MSFLHGLNVFLSSTPSAVTEVNKLVSAVDFDIMVTILVAVLTAIAAPVVTVKAINFGWRKLMGAFGKF
ncbi:hypothetical protein GMB34_14615 [Turicibacter sanguinis]|nr:hypothetical protein [Turicibacter sanguinis]MTN85349.1 hypothetical protein [Turicibacter sanguinis]MTN88222.1 hypothetical protein [Turicibacter sanguinis]MTN91096.1 hypothetical protein [Turicibacter sanguinis]MTN93949.1 hypothetical protein [Turicibacter sanguinis]